MSLAIDPGFHNGGINNNRIHTIGKIDISGSLLDDVRGNDNGLLSDLKFLFAFEEYMAIARPVFTFHARFGHRANGPIKRQEIDQPQV